MTIVIGSDLKKNQFLEAVSLSNEAFGAGIGFSALMCVFLGFSVCLMFCRNKFLAAFVRTLSSNSKLSTGYLFSSCSSYSLQWESVWNMGKVNNLYHLFIQIFVAYAMDYVDKQCSNLTANSSMAELDDFYDSANAIVCHATCPCDASIY